MCLNLDDASISGGLLEENMERVVFLRFEACDPVQRSDCKDHLKSKLYFETAIVDVYVIEKFFKFDEQESESSIVSHTKKAF